MRKRDFFVCGKDTAALGWREERIVDLGDISVARYVEAYPLFWPRLRGVACAADFNIGALR